MAAGLFRLGFAHVPTAEHVPDLRGDRRRLAVAAGGPSFKIRIRSQNKYLSSWSAAVVLSVALLQRRSGRSSASPSAASVVNVATRLEPIKAAFNVAKDVVGASAAVAAAHRGGKVPEATALVPDDNVSFWRLVGLDPSRWPLASIVYWLFDEAIPRR